MQCPGDVLDGDIAGGALHIGAGAQHLPPARRLEVTAKLLVDAQTSELRSLRRALEGQWVQLHIEGSACACGHRNPSSAAATGRRAGHSMTPGASAAVVLA